MNLRIVLGVLILLALIGGGGFYVAQKFLISPAIQDSTVYKETREVPSFDITLWQNFENDYFRLKYPSDWEQRAVGGGAFYSPDKKITLFISVAPLNDLRADIPDLYEFHRSFELGAISNDRNIAVSNLPAKTYDVKEDSGTKTEIVLITENYLYSFTLRPDISHPILFSILDTLEIKAK